MDMTNDRGMSSRYNSPTAEALAELFARSRPELESLFRRHWVSEEEAEELLDEALTALLLHWGQIENPALRLLAVVDKAIQRRLLLPLFH